MSEPCDEGKCCLPLNLAIVSHHHLPDDLSDVNFWSRPLRSHTHSGSKVRTNLKRLFRVPTTFAGHCAGWAQAGAAAQHAQGHFRQQGGPEGQAAGEPWKTGRAKGQSWWSGMWPSRRPERILWRCSRPSARSRAAACPRRWTAITGQPPVPSGHISTRAHRPSVDAQSGPLGTSPMAGMWLAYISRSDRPLQSQSQDGVTLLVCKQTRATFSAAVQGFRLCGLPQQAGGPLCG